MKHRFMRQPNRRLVGLLAAFCLVVSCQSIPPEEPIFQRSVQLDRTGNSWTWYGKLETGEDVARKISPAHVEMIRRVEAQAQSPAFGQSLVAYLETRLAEQFDSLPIGGVGEVAGLVNLGDGTIEGSRTDPAEAALRKAMREWAATGSRDAFADLVGVIDRQLGSLGGTQLVTRTSPRLRQFLALYQSRVQGKPLDWYDDLFSPDGPKIGTTRGEFVRAITSLGPVGEEAARNGFEPVHLCRVVNNLALCLLRLWSTQEEDYKLRERASSEQWHFHIHANPFPPSEGDVRIATMEQQPHFVIVPVIQWSSPPGAWEVLRDLFAGVPLRLQVWVAVAGGCTRLEAENGRWLQVPASPRLTTLWGSLIALHNLWSILPRYDLAELSQNDWRQLEQLLDLLPAMLRDLQSIDVVPRALAVVDRFLADVLDLYFPQSPDESAFAARLQQELPNGFADTTSPAMEPWELRFWQKLSHEMDLGLPQSPVRRIVRIEPLVRHAPDELAPFPQIREFIAARHLRPEDRLGAYFAMRFNRESTGNSLVPFDPPDVPLIAVYVWPRLRWPKPLLRQLHTACAARATDSEFANYLVNLWARLPE